jgi:hypothetical protein
MSSSKNTYRLINPYIEGSVDTTVKAKNSFSAGKKIYNNISDYFTNHVEDFNMTIQNLETKGLTHFRINEKKTNGNAVDFNLVKLEGDLPAATEKKLINVVDGLDKQTGGRKHHHHHRDDDSSESSSSSSSEDNYFRIPVVQPISKFVYFNLPYYKFNLVGLSPLDKARLFMPIFSLPINPTYEIVLDIFQY